MSLLTNIKQSVEHFGEFISGEFGKFFQEIEPIAKTDALNLLNSLLPEAVSIVTGLATGQLSSSAKRDAAISQLAAHAEANGIAAGTSLLSTAVELGLQIAKADAPASFAASSPDPAPAAPAPASGDGAPAPAAQ